MTLKENTPEFFITKLASDTQKSIECISKVVEIGLKKHKNSFTGIGHTRWATCGGKTDANAHPHFDTKHRIALVHNGTLDNFQELKEELLKNPKVSFTSETDTEVIAQLIGLYIDTGLTLIDAV